MSGVNNPGFTLPRLMSGAIQPLLGYTQWRRFEDAVEWAITSCKNSWNKPHYHFAGAGKVIAIGKGVGKEVGDAIKRIGGIPPEHLPPAEHIKLVEKRVKGGPPNSTISTRSSPLATALMIIC